MLEVEYARAAETRRLRQWYDRECRRQFDIDAPPESFNRLLFEQLTHSEGIDPIFKNPEVIATSEVLYNEIRNAFPISVYIPRREHNNPYAYQRKIKQLRDSAVRFRSSIRSREYDVLLDDMNEWLSKSVSEKSFTCTNALRTFSASFRTCSESFMRAKVFEINRRLMKSVLGMIDKLRTIRSSAVHRDDSPSTYDHARLAVKEDIVYVYYRDDVVQITRLHATKLERLFQIHSHLHSSQFVDHLYVVLRRYLTLMGPSESEGKAFHSALPRPIFDLLGAVLGVRHEAFASPLNCYLYSYHSAFYDIDRFFGSSGSFFDYFPEQGAFEVGPPYTIEVLDKTVEHIHEIFRRSDKPLSFVFFAPLWNDPPAQFLSEAESSRFLRGKCLIESGTYTYVSGEQHLLPKSEWLFRLPITTVVYFFQNDAAWTLRPASAETMDTMKKMFRDLEE